MKDFIKVDGHSNLVRDSGTHAILNTNTIEYNQYKRLKELKSEESSKIEKFENDLNEMKSDINEIKNLLRNLSK